MKTTVHEASEFSSHFKGFPVSIVSKNKGTSAWLAKLMKHQSAEWEVAGSNTSWNNAQGLKITEDESAAFAMTSVNG